MSQSPVTVTYSLEEIFKQINQKLDNLQKDVTEIKISQARLEGKLESVEAGFKGKLESVEAGFKGKLESVEAEIKGKLESVEAGIKGDIKTLDEKVNGLSKCLEFQEFINKGVLVGLVVAIIGGAAKLFGWIGNP